jgi:hypothetical protein
MERSICLAVAGLAFLLVSCASTGPVPGEDGTYTISKKSAAPGLGVSLHTKADVEREAHDYCGSKGLAVSVIAEHVMPAEPGRLGYTEPRFTCGAAISKQLASATKECRSSMSTPQLDPIRLKVELLRESADFPVPFRVATNDTFPSGAERDAIRLWASLREECNRRADAISRVPPSATALQTSVIQGSIQLYRQAEEQTGELLVALYNQKLTYGEFAQKRYEIGRDAATAELAYRQSALEKDEQRALQLRQIAEQAYANQLNAMANYIQAVNARNPLEVHVSGSINVHH